VIRKDFTLPSFFDGSAVLLERIFAKRLPRAGSRCCTNTYAMPVLAGMPARSAENDSSPPAEAPMPTIGKDIAFSPKFYVTMLSAESVAKMRGTGSFIGGYRKSKAITMLGHRVSR
jgi:hypothetical protein